MDAIENVLIYLEQVLLSIQPEKHLQHEQHWYLTPRQHILELIFFTLIFGSIAIYALALSKRRKHFDAPAVPWSLTPIEHLFRIAMTINLVATICYKIYRGPRVMWYILQPCHITTFVYLLGLYSTNNYRRSHRIFQAAIHFGFVTVLAILFPDTADLVVPGEVFFFWTHHWVLLFYPLYELWINRFPLDQTDFYWYWIAMAANGFVHYWVQTPAGFISGINVEYMLWPPPGTPGFCNCHLWRRCATVMMFTCSFLWGYVIPPLVNLPKRFLGRKMEVAMPTTSSSRKKKKN